MNNNKKERKNGKMVSFMLCIFCHNKKVKKKKLSDKEIANLSDAECKTLVIRMLTEMVEYGHKIEEKVKAVKSEVEKNIQ